MADDAWFRAQSKRSVTTHETHYFLFDCAPCVRLHSRDSLYLSGLQQARVTATLTQRFSGMCTHTRVEQAILALALAYVENLFVVDLCSCLYAFCSSLFWVYPFIHSLWFYFYYYLTVIVCPVVFVFNSKVPGSLAVDVWFWCFFVVFFVVVFFFFLLNIYDRNQWMLNITILWMSCSTKFEKAQSQATSRWWMFEYRTDNWE